ncbi:MAG TPA: DUF4178 domain-containing protein [Chloroflexia bacterium]|nr:DUF4178 domain-containing protein [Chloroflexia bacterium]
MSVEVNQLSCPNCGAPLDIKTLGRSKTIVCESCRSQIDLTRPPYQVIGNVGARPAPVITPFQLGMQGAIGPDTYQIIGRVRYSDDEDQWDEWLLLSGQGAYRWLSDSEDVGLVLWYPFTPTAPVNPASIDRGAVLDLGGGPVRIRSRGTATITYQEGELTWRASLGDTMHYAEGVAGDTLISVEWTANEIEFYGGQRLDRGLVAQAFGLGATRELAGAGAGAPGPGGPGAGRRGGCSGGTILFIIIIVVIVLFVLMDSTPGVGAGFFPSVRSGSSGRSITGGGSGGGGK